MINRHRLSPSRGLPPLDGRARKDDDTLLENTETTMEIRAILREIAVPLCGSRGIALARVRERETAHRIARISRFVQAE
jgi:hypothetical protein